MRVFVLGHRGMLGHVVTRYFTEKKFEVLTTANRFTGAPEDPLVREVAASGADWVINAIGLSLKNAANERELFRANAELPVYLRNGLPKEQRVIHASTDGVFSGKKGNYSPTDVPDAEDAYGRSKRLGEACAESGRCYSLRVSIIGPEIGAPRSLLSWFLSQTNTATGYTNHYWNGITTLHWAQIAFRLVTGEFDPPQPLFQPGSPERLSKFDLLKTISKTWAHPIPIVPTEAKDSIDRTLLPDPRCPPISEQLAELRTWYPR